MPSSTAFFMGLAILTMAAMPLPSVASVTSDAQPATLIASTYQP
jgi:hypothetical protein